jgi:hypothetical protein
MTYTLREGRNALYAAGTRDLAGMLVEQASGFSSGRSFKKLPQGAVDR